MDSNVRDRGRRRRPGRSRCLDRADFPVAGNQEEAPGGIFEIPVASRGTDGSNLVPSSGESCKTIGSAGAGVARSVAWRAQPHHIVGIAPGDEGYRTARGRGKVIEGVVGQAKEAIARLFRSASDLLSFWRDEASHGLASTISEIEAYTALGRLATDHWGELTQPGGSTIRNAANRHYRPTAAYVKNNDPRLIEPNTAVGFDRGTAADWLQQRDREQS